MWARFSRRLTKVLFVIIISWVVFSPLTVNAQATVPGFLKNGPYIDTLVFRILGSGTDGIRAIMNNDIDITGGIDPTDVGPLEETGYIETSQKQRNGYGFITINCEKYPLNYSALRRALALAIDKRVISDHIWEGFAVPIDCVLPIINPYSPEDQLTATYYEAHPDLGNQLLEDAGFLIWEGESFRRAPNGERFSIIIEASPVDVANQICAKIVEALTALHIEAEHVPTSIYEFFPRLNFHGDYDICFMGNNFPDFTADWLAYEFWGGYADEPYWNKANFENETYDSWREQLLHSLSYEEVYEAAIEMQKILHYECPRIPLYANLEVSAFRTDFFEGHVSDIISGIHGWWNNYKVHLKHNQGGPFGGTFRRANSKLFSFNHLTTRDSYSAYIWKNLYDTLMRYDKDGNLVYWLAESFQAETHADNQNVPDGYTRFTFDIIQNATWTDGQPLTASDVAFTLNYLRDIVGCWRGFDLVEMTGAYARTQYEVVVEFNSESFWHLDNVAFKHIIPQHVWSEIGLDSWNEYNPMPPTDTMVTSGPFIVTEHIEGEFTELTHNPNYFYALERSTTTTTNPTPPISSHQEFAFVAAALAAAAVIFIGGYIILRME